MPRLRQNADRDTMKDFVADIKAQATRYGCNTQSAMGKALGLCQGSVGNYLREPETIRLGVLRNMCKTFIGVSFVVKSTMAPTVPARTTLWVAGENTDKERQIVEMVPQVPGQMSFDNEEQEAPAISSRSAISSPMVPAMRMPRNRRTRRSGRKSSRRHGSLVFLVACPVPVLPSSAI